MIGSANAQYVPLVLDGHTLATKSLKISGGIWTNADTNNKNAVFTLPLPTNRGGKKLYINAFNIIVKDADSNNKVTNASLKGLTYNSFVELAADATDLETVNSASDTHEYTFTAVDCSGYDKINLTISDSVATAGNLDYYPMVKCYYDT